MMNSDVPDAELLIAPGCVHCPVVLAGLAELLKQGRIGRLEVFNIAARPDAAQARGARSVPWIRIGPFEMTGAHSQSELAVWVERAGTAGGQRTYLIESLESGQLDTVLAACRRNPQLLRPLLSLAGDLDTPFAVRIGVGAVIEDLAPDGLLADAVEDMVALAASPHPQVRADAAHFLGLVGNDQAWAALDRLAHDESHEVREIAGESLAARAAPDDLT
ncbi:MAG: HEAT repeat domain-containing protein [Gammaproteobacteria bacterium]|nr:HEAT repeat domain-containing protein [Gammaproteobacteria bacterium]